MGNEELTVGLVDEIQLSGGFFDFEEKYTLKTSAIHCPARIPPEAAARVQEAARTIFRALVLSSLSITENYRQTMMTNSSFWVWLLIRQELR